MNKRKNALSIIPLSRWRAVLAQARRGRRAEALLEQPDAAQLIPALPVQDFYYLAKEVDTEVATELIKLASPEQIQNLFDFDGWKQDTLTPTQLDSWFDALLDTGPVKFASIVGAIDPELTALYLLHHCRVYDLTLDGSPEEPEGHFYPTPDGAFLLDVLSDGEAGKRAERMVDWLYRADASRGREVVMQVRWELSSDLEEWAYRWRAGRMADLGFVEYYEALEIYRWLEPSSIKLEVEQPVEATKHVLDDAPTVTLPALFADHVGSNGLLGRALATIGEADELDRIQAELVAIMNQALAADRVEPSDLASAPSVLGRAVAYLSLALELVARGDALRAGQALKIIPLARLFRAGWSLTLKLKRAADTLVSRGWVTLLPGELSLLDEPYRSVVAGLQKTRPSFALALEKNGKPGERPFETLSDIALTTQALERAARIGPLLRDDLGVEPRLLEAAVLERCSPDRRDITFNLIAATLIANAILRRPASLVPLMPTDIGPLREQVLLEQTGAAPLLRPVARLTAQQALENKLKDREATVPHDWDEWLSEWFSHLSKTLEPSAIASPGAMPGLNLKLLVRSGPLA